MIAGRRDAHTRHELRLGSRELVVFGVAFVVVCGLIFALGVLVGREFPAGAARASARPAVGGRTEPTSPPAGAPSPPNPTEERLTFYKTLTAPTLDLPVAGPPKIEERIVPRNAQPESPAKKAEKAGSPEKHPASVAPAEPAPRGRPAAPPAAAQAAPASPEPPLWTVQVSSFRSRGLADELRGRLGARGYDAYLLSTATEEGRVRYRVRVGAFQTRGEAERVAAELRSERSLNPFVTARSR